MNLENRQQIIFNLLHNFYGLEPLKKLFWSELNYERVNQPLSRRGWTDNTSNTLVEDPLLFAAGGQDNDFHVIYAQLSSDRLLLGHERPVVSRLQRDHPYALFVLSNKSQDNWHLINIKYDQELEKRRRFRRITIGPEERLRTASERLTLLDLESINRDLFGLSPLAIQERHDEAFDVEAVTKVFFDEYKAVFHLLQDELTRQTKNHSWAHDYALQFLNRCMFLYFIQRKGWLGENKEFLRTFWESYQDSAQSKDSFVENWLKVLFFEAFNNKFHGGHRHFPKNIQEALAIAPFLNGGLFTENALDRKYNATISDMRFEQIFCFLERYNFTIAEDSPLDQEVAVDPEMIGKVYESLVNVEETSADKRSAAGIFYTPRTEIDLMCRLAMVDHLTNHLGEEHRSLLYQLFFALEPDEKEEADRTFADANLWHDLNIRLREIAILDPACGSGSFLVGMLTILNDLQDRAGNQLGFNEPSYDRKRRIIGQSLYGVDVMDWACHVAELRLWLALIIDAEFTQEDLHIRREPLLPHFSFKIRRGDSLVQEVGGINLGHMRGWQQIPRDLSARIIKLKAEKLKFYNNDPTCSFRSPDHVMQEELRLFREILAVRSLKIQEEIKPLRWKIEGPVERQMRLDGSLETRPHQEELSAIKWRKQIESLNAQLESIENSRAALNAAQNVPFVWDIAFVEIFEGEKEGFDIVIGNPPYVRQEHIADPHLDPEEVTTENKKIYKGKLARSVYQAFPRFFGYNAALDSASHKIDAKSDLYIYFYFHGLSLLNPKGSFCFITSNSWLDVGYGKDLQEFLLKHSHVKMILDNEAKRSFAQADINTIIVLFSSPDDRRDWALDKTARFVMFKVPFEHILSPIIFDEIEGSDERKTTPEYRAHSMQQNSLLEVGWSWPEDTTEEEKERFGRSLKTGRYSGNKWGGKYLRAPDIYWTILEKGKGKLVRLGEVAEVRRGFTSGANEFFYLDEARIREWGIEEEFLKPVIKSPRELKRIFIDPKDLKFKIFVCDKEKTNLKGTAALEYITWGESKQFHNRPSCAGRTKWWQVPLEIADSIFVKESNDTSAVFYNPHNLPLDCRLYCANLPPASFIFLNSAVAAMMFEIYNRVGLGEGARSLMVADYAIVPSLLEGISESAAREIADTISQLPPRKLKEPPGEKWNNLDKAIFDIFRLSQGEVDAVYEAVINLVQSRLKKAESLQPARRQERIDAARKTRGIWEGLPYEIEED